MNQILQDALEKLDPHCDECCSISEQYQPGLNPEARACLIALVTQHLKCQHRTNSEQSDDPVVGMGLNQQQICVPSAYPPETGVTRINTSPGSMSESKSSVWPLRKMSKLSSRYFSSRT